jgi:hypothetical protein
MWDRRGRNRTGVASISEKGSAIELPATEIRDKESNLDFHVQSVASCRLDDPGAKSSCELCFPCHSPTLRPWITARAVSAGASYVEGLWSPSLGRSVRKAQAKADAIAMSSFHSRRARVFLSQAGPRVDLGFLKLSITLSLNQVRLRNDRGDPLGRLAWSRHAASCLAHARPREGTPGVEAEARVGGGLPQRRPSGDKIDSGVVFVAHHCEIRGHRHHRSNPRSTQGPDSTS